MNSINKAYKFRLYPTKEQEVFLNKHFGSVRFIYNHLLSYRRESYKNGTKISGLEAKRLIPALKAQETYAWLKEINAQSLQQASLDLETAYQRFFKKVSKYPSFKKKHLHNSFTVPQKFKVKPEGGLISIPKLKTPLKVEFHREMKNVMKFCSLTISKTPTGKYFVSILVEELVEALPTQSTKVGLDLGLKHFVTTSGGEKVDSPKFLKRQKRKLKRSQRRHSKKQKGSQNKNKSRVKLAKIHEKVANQREDFLHKLSHEIVLENQEIYLEDLGIRGMMKNHTLAGSIGDSGWGEFVRQLKYKGLWYGRRVVQINRFAPTSKMCHNCKWVYAELKLSDREWTCAQCHMTHDRDINAAINVLLIGQEMPESTPVKKRVSTFSVKRMQASSLKQESHAS